MKLALISIILGGFVFGCGSTVDNPSPAENNLIVDLKVKFSDGEQFEIKCPGCSIPAVTALAPEKCNGVNCESLLLPGEQPVWKGDPPERLICTQQYGGPETVRVEGVVQGEQIDFERNRTNGCQIDQYNKWVQITGKE